jgi:hypothetical protein
MGRRSSGVGDGAERLDVRYRKNGDGGKVLEISVALDSEAP